MQGSFDPSDKRTIAQKYGKKGTMDKKVPQSNKYANVKSTLNTGKTAKDVEIISDKLVSKRKFEGFKRIKCSTLVKLLGEVEEEAGVESIYRLGNEDDGEEIKDTESVTAVAETETMRSV